MKLSIDTPNVQKSTEFKDAKFGIGDMALVFEILRSKMYPNPIKTLTQELMCNARDAHREVKKARTPIEVHLPTTLEPYWAVRDFGPGITPARMADVFINYGASTKRDSNKQTGGFGLGAKSPFSYTDAFCIDSITPEISFEDSTGTIHENCMVLRKYIAYIDESRVGTMSLVGEEVTSQEQGTRITVAVKKQDFDNFINWTASATEFWTLKPKFNMDKKHAVREFLFEKDDWKIEKVRHDGGEIYAILDGISYHVDRSNLELEEYPFTHYTNLYLYFDTGELAITANREHLDYKDDTKKALHSAIGNVVDYVASTIQTEIDKMPNLWEAYKQLNKSVNSIGVKKTFSKGALKWTNIELNESCEIYTYNVKGLVLKRYKISGDNKVGVDNKSCSTPACISPCSDILVWNDEVNSGPDTAKLRTVFVDTGCSYLLVITSITPEAVKEINLEYLNPIKLSKMTKTKLPKNFSGGTSSKCLIKEYQNFISWTQNWKTTTLKLEDGSGNVYVRCEGNYPYVGGSQILRSYDFELIRRYLGKSIYRISNMISEDKVIKAGWVNIETAINNKLKELITKLGSCPACIEDKDNLLVEFSTFGTDITSVKNRLTDVFFDNINKDSLAHKYLTLCLNSSDGSEYSGYLNAFNFLSKYSKSVGCATNNNTVDGVNLRRSFIKKYPLMVDAFRFLSSAGSNCYPYFGTQDLVDYVNFIDKKA